MKRVFVLSLILSLFVALMGCGEEPAGPSETGPEPVKAETIFASIGTGGMSGVYYPTGGNIARMVNNKKDTYGVNLKVESTNGSVFNINAVLAGDMELGIAQSDRQYQAYKGLAEWEQYGAQDKLRSVFSLYVEAVTLVAADDANIKSLADLKGKRVNIGDPGSGMRQNVTDCLKDAGIDPETDIKAESVKAAEGPSLLQDNRIDAFFYTVGHPNGTISEATVGRRKVHFVPIEVTDELLERNPYYVRTRIPIKEYPQATNEADVVTFGMKATVVTSADVDGRVIEAVTTEVFENLEEFKTLHPAYGILTAEDMLQGMTAPFHPAAEAYFKSKGLME